jgi:hypothetical protein
LPQRKLAIEGRKLNRGWKPNHDRRHVSTGNICSGSGGTLRPPTAHLSDRGDTAGAFSPLVRAETSVKVPAQISA